MNKATGRIFILGCAINLASALGVGSHIQAQANFFQEKTLRVIRGGQAGDLFDLWTRHIATYFGKYIPGHPSVMVQNMPGAGSVIAANYVFRHAKPDGLTIGSVSPGIYMDQLVGRKEVQHDEGFRSPERSEKARMAGGGGGRRPAYEISRGSNRAAAGNHHAAEKTFGGVSKIMIHARIGWLVGETAGQFGFCAATPAESA